MENEKINPNITEQELIDLSEEYMCLFGVNINLQRAIPMVVDGLKPVTRRILYTMYKHYRNSEVLVSTLSGRVTGEIHPHGDMGMGGVISRLAQPFTNNYPLLESIGNAGNEVAGGSDFASPRYLTVKLNKFALDILFDEFDGKVNMVPSYNPSILEPLVLPAKFPLILLNGTAGIGYTLSSDIYPYNINEIADATIKLLKNPNANVKLIPDSPSGCDIIVQNEETFVMQSSFSIDNVNYTINIKNAPYLKNIDSIDTKLRELQDSSNPIPEILSAAYESETPGNISYVIECKPCNLYNVINTLFRRVPGFRSTISTKNMVIVDDLKTHEYTIRQILCSWVQYRLKAKRYFFLRKLVATTTECNMLEGKAFMLSPENLENTVRVFRSCNSKSEIIPALVKAYEGKVTTSQANYISEVRLYALTNQEYEKTLKSIDEIKGEIEYVRSVVNDPEKIRDVVIDEIKTIKNTYGSPRKSKILNIGDKEVNNIEVVQILTDGSVLFGETENPEHPSSDITLLSSNSVCLVDEYGNLTSIGRIPMGKCVCALSNQENKVLLLTNKGRIKYMPINKIPTNASRKPLVPLDDNETIVSALELRDSSMDILVYSTNGYGKRIRLSTLNCVLSVDAMGQFIMSDHEVAGMFVINPTSQYLVYVTKLGRLRVNHSKFLLAGKKFSEPKPIIKLSPQDDLISVFCVTDKQTVTLYHADSRVSTVNIGSMKVSTMSAEPVRPKHVPGVRVIRATLS
jgi:DNA gyrase/topoisomerase IV subunit A